MLHQTSKCSVDNELGWYLLKINNYCYLTFSETWLNIIDSQAWILLSITSHVKAETSHFYSLRDRGLLERHSGSFHFAVSSSWAKLSLTLYCKVGFGQLWKIPSLLETLTSLEMWFLKVANRYKAFSVLRSQKKTSAFLLICMSMTWSCFIPYTTTLWILLESGCRRVLSPILA